MVLMLLGSERVCEHSDSFATQAFCATAAATSFVVFATFCVDFLLF